MLRSLAILLSGVALAACTASTNSDAAMIVLQNMAPPITGICSFTPTIGQAGLSSGLWSIGSFSPYILNPLIQSRVTAVMGSELERTITLQGADVHVTVQSASVATSTGTTNPTITLSPTDSAFKALFAGTVAPNGGLTALGMNLLPTTILDEISQQTGASSSNSVHVTLLADIDIYGTMGGGRVDAVPFQYPVTVCNDCIVDVIGTCPVTGAVATGNPCNIFQDEPVDCCTESTGKITCPARSQ